MADASPLSLVPQPNITKYYHQTEETPTASGAADAAAAAGAAADAAAAANNTPALPSCVVIYPASQGMSIADSAGPGGDGRSPFGAKLAEALAARRPERVGAMLSGLVAEVSAATKGEQPPEVFEDEANPLRRRATANTVLWPGGAEQLAGKTPLHIAALANSASVAQALLEHAGVDANARDKARIMGDDPHAQQSTAAEGCCVPLGRR